MRSTCVALFLAAACLLCSSPAHARDTGSVVGAIWTYTLQHGDKHQTGQFRVYKGDVFLKDKKVGQLHWKDEDEATLTIGGIPSLNGTASLRKVKRKPVTALGKLRKTDGVEWDIRMEVTER